MTDIEFLSLGEFDPETRSRVYEVISHGQWYFNGSIRHVTTDSNEQVRVFANTSDMSTSECATTPGPITEVTEDGRALRLISRAVLSCFDYAQSTEAIPDEKGGWIILRSDT